MTSVPTAAFDTHAGIHAGIHADAQPPKVIAIVGPTGSGKSGLADRLAHTLGGEVISADSMQIYRGMDIGTAKTPPHQRSVPYHGIDLVDPGTPFSAALYQEVARAALDDIRVRGSVPIICGGTGLYLRAALDDFTFPEGPSGRSRKRDDLEQQALALGPDRFHGLLMQRDPDSALLIHPHNTRRVVRAFEMLEEGTSYAQQYAGFSSYEAVYPTRFIGITVEPTALYETIGRRVDSMIERGLLDEVRALIDAGFIKGVTARQAIGYKEFVSVLTGERPLEQAIDEVKQSTRRYAKRQRTWFKRDGRIRWIDATDLHRKIVEGKCNSADLASELHMRVLELLEW